MNETSATWFLIIFLCPRKQPYEGDDQSRILRESRHDKQTLARVEHLERICPNQALNITDDECKIMVRDK